MTGFYASERSKQCFGASKSAEARWCQGLEFAAGLVADVQRPWCSLILSSVRSEGWLHFSSICLVSIRSMEINGGVYIKLGGLCVILTTGGATGTWRQISPCMFVLGRAGLCQNICICGKAECVSFPFIPSTKHVWIYSALGKAWCVATQ